MDLQTLLERVKAASGPDGALDLDIADTLKCYRGFNCTGSIDAALALVERVLPEGTHALIDTQKPNPDVSLFDAAGKAISPEIDAATPALAILAALLTALIAQKAEAAA